jgi:quinoprotein glucose dehydrogenase
MNASYAWVRNFLLAFLLIQFTAGSASCSQIVGGRPQEIEDTFLYDVKGIQVESWIQNLEIPWSLVFLGDGRALVSERPGRIRIIREGKLQGKPYALIEVAHTGEAGLLGLAIHPEFPRKPYIYAMHTYEKDNRLFNRVIRLKDKKEGRVFDKVIIDGIPGGRFHNGGSMPMTYSSRHWGVKLSSGYG